MATEHQLRAGLKALAEYDFQYLDLLRFDEAAAGLTPPQWVGCASSYPGRRVDFVAKMLARTRRCEVSEASWRRVGQALELPCDDPYASFDASHLAAQRSRLAERLQCTLYAFDHTGPCGLADFSVRLESLELTSGVPHFILSLDCLYLSEDRRGEGLGAELAACAIDALLQIVADVSKAITRRGRLALTLECDVISISGWTVARRAATCLAERLGAHTDDYDQGRLQSRPVTLECVTRF